MPGRRTTAGFTFIEMAVVLIVIGLGMTVALPMIEGGFDSREVRRAARQIASTIHHCRGEAVAHGAAQAMVIDPARNAVYASDWGRWAVLSERAQIDQIEGGERTNDGTWMVIFYPNGSTSGLSLLLGSRRDRSRERIHIQLDPLLGTVRVEG